MTSAPLDDVTRTDVLADLALLRAAETPEHVEGSREALVNHSEVVSHVTEGRLRLHRVGRLEVLVVCDQVNAVLLLSLDVVLQRTHHLDGLRRPIRAKWVTHCGQSERSRWYTVANQKEVDHTLRSIEVKQVADSQGIDIPKEVGHKVRPIREK